MLFSFFGEEFPRNIEIVLTIFMVLTSTKNNEVQFKFLEEMCHARESLHLENKNMLRTFLGLKLKKPRTSEGFLQFCCSYILLHTPFFSQQSNFKRKLSQTFSISNKFFGPLRVRDM